MGDTEQTSNPKRLGRHTRYQGAIVRDHHVLLIKERERSSGRIAWFFPGGGMEPGETAEGCVRREMKEETGLDIEVKGLFLDGPELHKCSPYQRHLTYLCEPVGGIAQAGSEGEEGHFSIVGIGWVDLRDEGAWPHEIAKDETARHFLRLIREKLGYMAPIRLSSDTRCQGAIVSNHRILLVKHREDASGRTYWTFPGGGVESGETEEDCVRREMREETGLEVRVVRVLLDEVADGRIRRQWMKTYLCEPLTGTPRLGVEPEGFNSIVEVRWFDLRDAHSWDNDLMLDPFTYPLLQRVQVKLGYLPEVGGSTPYPDVNTVLQELLGSVKAVLGNYFVGMYLGGSLAAGDFDPRRSDIDLLVVTTDELPENLIAGLQAMHDRIAAGQSKWAKELECCYIPVQSVRRYDPTRVRYPMIERYARLVVDYSGSDQVIQRHIVREHGIALAGPAPHTLIEPISPEDLRRAVLDILERWWAPMLDGAPIQMSGAGYRAYAVLSLCRMLYTLDHGTVVSKPVAARWARAKLGPLWEAVIDRALAWEDGGIPVDLKETLDLVRHTVQMSRQEHRR